MTLGIPSQGTWPKKAAFCGGDSKKGAVGTLGNPAGIPKGEHTRAPSTTTREARDPSVLYKKKSKRGTEGKRGNRRDTQVL